MGQTDGFLWKRKTFITTKVTKDTKGGSSMKGRMEPSTGREQGNRIVTDYSFVPFVVQSCLFDCWFTALGAMQQPQDALPPRWAVPIRRMGRRAEDRW